MADYKKEKALLVQLRQNLADKLAKGQTGVISEIKELVALEEKLKKQEESEKEKKKKTYGLPNKLKIKRRKYTLSGAALEQRKKALEKGRKACQDKGQATGPVTDEGKAVSSRNSWKHGTYAQSFFHRFSKPCKSTCPHFPCDLVEEGSTHPGAECLDKQHLMEAWNSIMQAVAQQNYDNFQAISTLEMAKSLQIVRDIQEAILEDGVVVRSEKFDREGNVIGYEIKAHPNLLILSNLIKDLGLTPPEMMITPRQLSKANTEKEGIKTLADIMSSIGKRKDTPDNE